MCLMSDSAIVFIKQMKSQAISIFSVSCNSFSFAYRQEKNIESWLQCILTNIYVPKVFFLQIDVFIISKITILVDIIFGT